MPDRYYVDDLGELWTGPCLGGQGFRYLRFHGCNRVGGPVWVWERYDPPENAEEISPGAALRIIDRYAADARSRA